MGRNKPQITQNWGHRFHRTLSNLRNLRLENLRNLRFVFCSLVLLLTACSGAGSPPAPAEPEYEGTRLSRPAPDFRLTDQNGAQASLSDFRGKVVVLTFMDTRCDETCPLTASEFLDAHRALGPRSPEAVFMAVNTNKDFSDPQDTRAFSDRFQMSEIPSWRFFTGPPQELAPVWRAYNIEVIAHDHQEDYAHTSGVFIIDRQGVMQWYVSVPFSNNSDQRDGASAGWDGPRLSAIIVRHVTALAAR